MFVTINYHRITTNLFILKSYLNKSEHELLSRRYTLCPWTIAQWQWNLKRQYLSEIQKHVSPYSLFGGFWDFMIVRINWQKSSIVNDIFFRWQCTFLDSHIIDIISRQQPLKSFWKYNTMELLWLVFNKRVINNSHFILYHKVLFVWLLFIVQSSIEIQTTNTTSDLSKIQTKLITKYKIVLFLQVLLAVR